MYHLTLPKVLTAKPCCLPDVDNLIVHENLYVIHLLLTDSLYAAYWNSNLLV